MENILRKYKGKVLTEEIIKILIKEIKDEVFDQEVIRSYREDD